MTFQFWISLHWKEFHHLESCLKNHYTDLSVPSQSFRALHSFFKSTVTTLDHLAAKKWANTDYTTLHIKAVKGHQCAWWVECSTMDCLRCGHTRLLRSGIPFKRQILSTRDYQTAARESWSTIAAGWMHSKVQQRTVGQQISTLCHAGVKGVWPDFHK